MIIYVYEQALNPTAEASLQCKGKWDLVFSSTQSFGSYPFSMAICATIPYKNKIMVKNDFNIHNHTTTALPIGHVCQTIATSKNLAKDQELILELDVELGVLPELSVGDVYETMRGDMPVATLKMFYVDSGLKTMR
eukprot:6458581-Ditylum_brightwellii.AAC.1